MRALPAFYDARSRYPRRIMHLRYAPTDLDEAFGGTDSNARWATSLDSFDWKVTHIPSHFGIWADWFGLINFEIRDLGICAGRVTPRQPLWSRTNCSMVTVSFSQFRTVAFSTKPLFGDAQPLKA